jgi:mannosyl-3-phosphoglycerate phosphatase
LLDNHEPFIVENGGAAFIPIGYFPFSYPHQQVIGGYHAIRDGLPYPSLVGALRAVRRESGARIVGFSDLSVEEVAHLTGLSREEAHFAKQRECDEPFLVVGSQRVADRIRKLLEKRGFMCARGGTFDHLTGHNGKGKAVSILAGLFQRVYGTVRTVGIGDSENDLPMLRAVDVPVLVQRPDGTHDPNVDLPHLIRVQGIGPTGWARTVLDLLSSGSEGG